MHITTPNEMVSRTSRVEEATRRFEEQFKREGTDQEYYHIIITGEYNRAVCDEIQKMYLDVGWSVVKCRTSSENGERGGLTGLQLWRAESKI